MSESIQEIPLDIAEQVEDIAEHIAGIEAEDEPIVAPPVRPVEEVKPVIKPKAKGRPVEVSTKGRPSLGPRRLRYKRLRWNMGKTLPRHTSPLPQRGISNYLRIRAPVMSRLPC